MTVHEVAQLLVSNPDRKFKTDEWPEGMYATDNGGYLMSCIPVPYGDSDKTFQPIGLYDILDDSWYEVTE